MNRNSINLVDHRPPIFSEERAQKLQDTPSFMLQSRCSVDNETYEEFETATEYRDPNGYTLRKHMKKTKHEKPAQPKLDVGTQEKAEVCW